MTSIFAGSMRYAQIAAVAGALALAASPASAAEGEPGHSHSGHGNGHAHNITGGHPGKASDVDRTIEIEARDIAFDREAIRVEAGETIRFVIRNTGNIDHDFTLGSADLQERHRTEMQRMMSGGMSPSEMDHDDPNAVMIPPGETRELIWTFAEAQNYEFACNIPGHYEAGMKGSVYIE